MKEQIESTAYTSKEELAAALDETVKVKKGMWA